MRVASFSGALCLEQKHLYSKHGMHLWLESFRMSGYSLNVRSFYFCEETPQPQQLINGNVYFIGRGFQFQGFSAFLSWSQVW